MENNNNIAELWLLLSGGTFILFILAILIIVLVDRLLVKKLYGLKRTCLKCGTENKASKFVVSSAIFAGSDVATRTTCPECGNNVYSSSDPYGSL